MAEMIDSTPARDPYVEAVRGKLLGRSAFGDVKYGVGLDRTDLSTVEWLDHAQEEVMDAANYLERVIQNMRRLTQCGHAGEIWLPVGRWCPDCGASCDAVGMWHVPTYLAAQ